jgi:hypothetical protein
MQLLLNPRRRRGKKKHHRRASSKRRRPMSALQKKYFGARRTRRVSRGVRVSSARSIVVRRNPIGAGLLGQIAEVGTNAAIGAVSAVAIDALMGQAARALPAALASRYSQDGNLNAGYFATKAGLATALGVVGVMFLPRRARPFAARATEGALTVQGADLLRSVLPANLVLGYYNPARVAGRGTGMSRLSAYTNVRRLPMRGLRGSFNSGPGVNIADTRVGEGPIQ